MSALSTEPHVCCAQHLHSASHPEEEAGYDGEVDNGSSQLQFAERFDDDEEADRVAERVDLGVTRCLRGAIGGEVLDAVKQSSSLASMGALSRRHPHPRLAQGTRRTCCGASG
jgi:hypothetical protein